MLQTITRDNYPAGDQREASIFNLVVALFIPRSKAKGPPNQRPGFKNPRHVTRYLGSCLLRTLEVEGRVRRNVPYREEHHAQSCM